MNRMVKILCAALSVFLLLIPIAQADAAAPTLLYMGQASIRIVTAEGKVIYIDPYAGDQYDLPADLILVTHGHFDHYAIDKVTNRNENCQIITHKEAVIDGVHALPSFPDSIQYSSRWGRREDDIGATLDDTFYHMKNAIIMQKFL